MSELISREAVMRSIHNYFIGLIEKGINEIDVVDCNAEICNEVIDKIETVYDVDKVVEKLELHNLNPYFGAYERKRINEAIEIVKGGS